MSYSAKGIVLDCDVLNEATSLADLACQNGSSGQLLDAKALDDLNADMGGRIPQWYIELMTKVPLAGLELGWQTDKESEIEDAIEWSDVSGIRSESIECYPGLAILERGYINVGSDSYGSGNPYFIPTDQGDNPPIYQVYHDVAVNADEILRHGRRQLAASLSEFFREAFVCSQT